MYYIDDFILYNKLKMWFTSDSKQSAKATYFRIDPRVTVLIVKTVKILIIFFTVCDRNFY